MAKAICQSKRVPPEFKTDTPCVERGRAVEPLFSLFVFLVSPHKEIRNAALVDAIAAEDDSDDWSELEALHAAQRGARHRAQPRGTAHGGQR